MGHCPVPDYALRSGRLLLRRAWRILRSALCREPHCAGRYRRVRAYIPGSFHPEPASGAAIGVEAEPGGADCRGRANWGGVAQSRRASTQRLPQRVPFDLAKGLWGGSLKSRRRLLPYRRTLASVRGGVPERPKGAGCKPAGIAYGGSNPPAPTETEYAPVAQTVEHFHGKEGVTGSSPVGGSGGTGRREGAVPLDITAWRCSSVG